MRKWMLSLVCAMFVLSGCAAGTIQPVHTEPPIVSNDNATENTTESIMTSVCTESAAATTLPLIDIPAGTHLRRYTSPQTGDYFDYYLFIPENAVAGMPLVVFLHGDGEVNNVDSLGSCGPILALREYYGDAFPCILIYPCTRQPSWTDGTVPETLMDLIGHVSGEFDTDPEHIIITGYSRGAIGVWYLISEYGDFFSSAVPVSCGSDRALNYENAAKVPVYALAGDEGYYENIYKREMEKIVSQILAENGTAVFKCLEGCGHVQTLSDAYSETVINWMLEK